MKLVNCYPQIISDANIWLAWTRFRAGKGSRADIQIFERSLETNLLELRRELHDRSYQHGTYRSFVVRDPKRRLIHVPTVRDQVVHQMVWNILFPFFNSRFSPSATSCRPGMGTSAARAIIRRWGKWYSAWKLNQSPVL
jgi:retron-type reverse transcriptase